MVLGGERVVLCLIDGSAREEVGELLDERRGFAADMLGNALGIDGSVAWYWPFR